MREPIHPARIADQIHDGPMQQLVGAKMWLDSIDVGTLSDESRSALTTALSALATAIEEMRAVMTELRGDLQGGKHVKGL